jgi:MoaA/NifB/PqqE/SkfB family radical SAM enzyme
MNAKTKTDRDVILLNGIDNFSREEVDALKRKRDAGQPEAILSIGISTTSACNIRCWYCYALENKGRRNPEQLSRAEYIDLIDQAVDLGARTMIVCGDGEPTYDPELVPIVVHARSKGLTPVVVTNGTVFGNDKISNNVHGMSGEELTQTLYDNGASLLVKLETLNPALYEEMVKVKSGWTAFEKGIERVKAAGFGATWKAGESTYSRLAFTGVATKENIDEISALKQFSRDNGAQFICKIPSPTGGAFDSIDKLFPVDKVDEIRAYIDNYTDKRETLTPIILDGDGCKTCLAWHLGPVISETGQYVECYTSTKDSFGSIREQSLKDILRGKQKNIDFDSPCPIKDRLYLELNNIKIVAG